MVKIQDSCCDIEFVGPRLRESRREIIDPRTFSTCYLCAEPLAGERTRDHVPPKQFFPKAFRKANWTNHLKWLPTHRSCNSAYQQDEDYFVHTFGLPAATQTFGGHVLGHDIRNRLSQGKQTKLVNAVLQEFEPDGLRKNFDSTRTERVAWKIIRGLHCLDTGLVLPVTPVVTGGFTCQQVPEITSQLIERLREGGFRDRWRGHPSMVFRYMCLVDKTAEVVNYSYLIVCWEFVLYFMSFQMKGREFVR